MAWLRLSVWRGGFAALLAACSDPSYDVREDAAAAPEAGALLRDDAAVAPQDARSAEDASPIVDASSPEPFPLGQYAVLARFYGTSAAPGGGWFGEETIVLADVQRADNGLTLRWQTCAYRGRLVVPLFPAIDYTVLEPETFPVRTLQLVVNGNTFSTLGEASLIGYQELTDCPVGGTQSHPDRPWLPGGQCSCPSSNIAPTSPSDCRVIDSDGDDQPGISVQFMGGTDNTSRSRIRDGSQLMAGLISPEGRHSAQWGANLDNYQLSCAREPCSRGSTQLCSLAQNPVRFLPLDARPFTCAEVVGVVDNSNQLGLGAITSPGC